MRFTTTVSRAIIGIYVGVSCYSQRKKILYISLRHSVEVGQPKRSRHLNMGKKWVVEKEMNIQKLLLIDNSL